MKKLIQDVKEPTPKINKVMAGIFATVTLAAGAILAAPTAGLSVPAALTTAAQWIVFIAPVLGLDQARRKKK